MMSAPKAGRTILFSLFPFLALTGNGQDSLNISLLDHWEDPSLPSSSIFDNAYNEVWGFVEDSTEYAVIGSTMGTHIFDLSDPRNIQKVDFVPGAHQGTDIIHRDYHDHQGHLYMVSDEGESTLQIVDLSPLPDSVDLVYDSEDLLKQAHNIFIDTSSDRLYACGAKTKLNSSEDLMLLDISTPDSPVHVRDYNSTEYFHDIFVRNDTAYGHHGDQAGLIVYDMSDPSNIDVLGTLPIYSDQGYNHSGWLSPSGDHYVMADETHGLRMKLLDVSDLSNIQEESLFLSGVSSNSIAHNPIIMGEHAYVGHYHDGVYIWNISDPQNPVITGYYDTYPANDHNSYRGNWGVYPFLPSGILLASDMQSGLFVLNVDSAKSSVNVKEHERSLPSVQCYPNPAQEELRAEFQSVHKGKVQLSLSDLHGRTLLHREWKEARKTHRLNIEGLESKGIHFLHIRTEKGSRTEKVMIR